MRRVVEMVSASRYIVVMSSSVGKTDSLNACGTYREMSSSTTEMLMFRVSSTSSSSVGSGTIIIPMMATTTQARTMSEYLDRKLLLWADMRVAILARPRL